MTNVTLNRILFSIYGNGRINDPKNRDEAVVEVMFEINDRLNEKEISQDEHDVLIQKANEWLDSKFGQEEGWDDGTGLEHDPDEF